MQPDDDDLDDDDLDDDDLDDDDLDDDDLDDDDLDDDDSKEDEPSPELYQRAQAAKLKRLFVEDKGRAPFTQSELAFFSRSSDVDHPIEPEDEDFETARKEAAD